MVVFMLTCKTDAIQYLQRSLVYVFVRIQPVACAGSLVTQEENETMKMLPHLNFQKLSVSGFH